VLPRAAFQKRNEAEGRIVKLCMLRRGTGSAGNTSSAAIRLGATRRSAAQGAGKSPQADQEAAAAVRAIRNDDAGGNCPERCRVHSTHKPSCLILRPSLPFWCHVAGAVCCCTLSVFGIIVLVAMGMMVSAGDPYIGGHHLVATAEVRHASSAAGVRLTARGLPVDLCHASDSGGVGGLAR